MKKEVWNMKGFFYYIFKDIATNENINNVSS